ncbi:phosphomannomutase/phosphoglucomutase [Candidatus Venteria ishoeyi]|uniref:phosphomannomutase n=1 Tax=Candidatus Venteria ishoeyi TaxID=1899563 RepID=A0A1H6F9U9_9GAMM|nr:phosphomannomutase/phosphoglucomutase [Candidatus Venteria ishoeyi]MDM8545767.1 phosphomannomutase/phosphoglucomutase [Candidatus Venteria ishoeyi]SEH06880.1 Phosphomannomutase/phosphoglucomutase [Candidatus Venteria ishoeyi]
MSIFRAYDIRGIVGRDLDEDRTMQIGHAIGSEAIARGQRRIVVARDGRLSGPMLLTALVAGLRASGCDVIDIGMVPTPVLYFAAWHLDTGSGVMLTASHNPANYNGMKIMLAGKTLFGDEITDLERRIEQQDFIDGSGTFELRDVRDDYLQRILSDVKLHKDHQPLRVVVDCGNGAAGELTPQLLKKMGCEVIELYCEVDGNFPNHHPDPTRPENLHDLIQRVKEYQADLGLGLDGDGDRLGVVDNQGGIIWADRQMMLYTRDVLSRNPGARIIYDVKCSRHLEKVIQDAGGEPLMWKTGHSFMKSKLEEGGLLAGEMSGHIFFKERWYGFDDGLYTAARLLEILSADPRPTSAVFAELPDAINTPELQLKMPEGTHFDFMQRFLEQAQFADAEVTRIDGLRVDFEHGWGLVRASNTTSCLVLRFEADDQAQMETIQEAFRAQLLALEADLKLPF